MQICPNAPTLQVGVTELDGTGVELAIWGVDVEVEATELELRGVELETTTERHTNQGAVSEPIYWDTRGHGRGIVASVR